LQVPHWVCSLNFQVIHIDALTESSIAKTWSNLQSPHCNLQTPLQDSDQIFSTFNLQFFLGWVIVFLFTKSQYLSQCT
jgi:hypothetical protein